MTPQIQEGLFDYKEILHVYSFGNKIFSVAIPDQNEVRTDYQNKKKDNNSEDFPFWAQVWPASLGLCQFLERHPCYIQEKKVVELGAGLGLPSLLAAHYSQHIYCTDLHPKAVQWARKSAIRNGLEHIHHLIADWNNLPLELSAETILLSDTNYEPDSFPGLLQTLEGMLQQNATVIISTPQRLMAKPFIEALLPWCIQSEVVEVNTGKQKADISVFVLSKQKEE